MGMQPIHRLVLLHEGEIKPMNQQVTGILVRVPWPHKESPAVREQFCNTCS